jgi:hypothetical protein
LKQKGCINCHSECNEESLFLLTEGSFTALRFVPLRHSYSEASQDDNRILFLSILNFLSNLLPLWQLLLKKSDTMLGVFAEQSLTARSWYQVDSAAMEKIFADMIDAVNLRRVSPRDALRDAEAKASLLMRR